MRLVPFYAKDGTYLGDFPDSAKVWPPRAKESEGIEGPRYKEVQAELTASRRERRPR